MFELLFDGFCWFVFNWFFLFNVGYVLCFRLIDDCFFFDLLSVDLVCWICYLLFWGIVCGLFCVLLVFRGLLCWVWVCVDFVVLW